MHDETAVRVRQGVRDRRHDAGRLRPGGAVLLQPAGEIRALEEGGQGLGEDEGAAAIVVSNHGGRQLDGVSPSLRALPEVVAAVKDQAEVLMDGGVRRGTDIVKAVCLGARAVLCGRGYAYGLAAAGEAGVKRAIEILRADVERTLRLLGCASVSALDSSYVDARKLCS